MDGVFAPNSLGLFLFVEPKQSLEKEQTSSGMTANSVCSSEVDRRDGENVDNVWRISPQTGCGAWTHWRVPCAGVE